MDRLTERDTIAGSPLVPVREVAPRLSIGERPHGLSRNELVKLHHTLAKAMPSGTGIVAQLVSPERDAAITDVAYDLAYISAAWLEKRVLYVNGADIQMPDGRMPVGQRHDGDASWTPPGPLHASFDAADLEQSITRVIGLELYLMTFPSMRDALDLAPVLRRIPRFMDRLRETFDLVIIAAPAVAEAPIGMLLSPYVDGNVLVLRSGRVRAPVAAELRDSLRAAGGSVVGVVLTRCRSFAPRWLRRWL
jgi:protein-tyrosine kinase